MLSFLNNLDKLKLKGIDFIVCVFVNDFYIMNVWVEKLGVKDKVGCD